MQNFVSNDKQNIFRLPVGWQYLVPAPGSPLIAANFANYDKLIRSCLATGAHCIIDIHNYARWNGVIVGQAGGGGPSGSDLANLWGQLAKEYAKETKVVMGIMNEPHEVEIEVWATVVQECVDAIRNAGATSQMILMPGSSPFFLFFSLSLFSFPPANTPIRHMLSSSLFLPSFPLHCFHLSKRTNHRVAHR